MGRGAEKCERLAVLFDIRMKCDRSARFLPGIYDWKWVAAARGGSITLIGRDRLKRMGKIAIGVGFRYSTVLYIDDYVREPVWYSSPDRIRCMAYHTYCVLSHL